MDLFQEYKNQQKWRKWERYLRFLPFDQKDLVIDLGCSVGNVSRLFSTRVQRVIGIDINQKFIEFCEVNKLDNEEFICSDLLGMDYSNLGSPQGVWASFSLSYLSDPLSFLKTIYASMDSSGWIALLDVSCFISGNMAKESVYYERVKTFELESHTSGIYDFSFGSKMRDLLESAGFEVLRTDNNVEDLELNFSGAAKDEVIDGWLARLERMEKLRNLLGSEYRYFCDDFIANISSDSHERRDNVNLAVGRKCG
jgi:SAM-dependent methyltransferase